MDWTVPQGLRPYGAPRRCAGSRRCAVTPRGCLAAPPNPRRRRPGEHLPGRRYDRPVDADAPQTKAADRPGEPEVPKGAHFVPFTPEIPLAKEVPGRYVIRKKPKPKRKPGQQM